jgi:gluconolactonase
MSGAAREIPVDRMRPLGDRLQHPEGVVWDPVRKVLFAGGDGGELYRITLDGQSEQVLQLPAGAFLLGLALDAAGRIYACDRGRAMLLRIDPDSTTVEELSVGTVERPMHTPNYPAFLPNGSLLVSDSGLWGEDTGVIFRVEPDGRTAVWARAPARFTNGLCLAPDATAVYVAESRGERVWTLPLDSSGRPRAPELVVRIPGAVPDGLAFDATGRLYVACYRPDAVMWIDVERREHGVLVQDPTGITLAAPTNIAFAGEQRDVLVTANLGGYHLNAMQLDVSGEPIVRPIVSTPEQVR